MLQCTQQLLSGEQFYNQNETPYTKKDNYTKHIRKMNTLVDKHFCGYWCYTLLDI